MKKLHSLQIDPRDIMSKTIWLTSSSHIARKHLQVNRNDDFDNEN